MVDLEVGKYLFVPVSEARVERGAVPYNIEIPSDDVLVSSPVQEAASDIIRKGGAVVSSPLRAAMQTSVWLYPPEGGRKAAITLDQGLISQATVDFILGEKGGQTVPSVFFQDQPGILSKFGKVIGAVGYITRFGGPSRKWKGDQLLKGYYKAKWGSKTDVTCTLQEPLAWHDDLASRVQLVAVKAKTPPTYAVFVADSQTLEALTRAIQPVDLSDGLRVIDTSKPYLVVRTENKVTVVPVEGVLLPEVNNVIPPINPQPPVVTKTEPTSQNNATRTDPTQTGRTQQTRLDTSQVVPTRLPASHAIFIAGLLVIFMLLMRWGWRSFHRQPVAPPTRQAPSQLPRRAARATNKK